MMEYQPCTPEERSNCYHSDCVGGCRYDVEYTQRSALECIQMIARPGRCRGNLDINSIWLIATSALAPPDSEIDQSGVNIAYRCKRCGSGAVEGWPIPHQATCPTRKHMKEEYPAADNTLGTRLSEGEERKGAAGSQAPVGAEQCISENYLREKP